MRPAVPILALMATGALLTACAGSAHSVPETAPTARSVSIDNGGTLVTFPKAPERVATIKSSTAEMLLALGAGDRIVGMAYPDGPLPEDAPEIPMLADQVPSQEAVLELEPDLVYAGWESNLSVSGAGERAMYESLGVKTFVGGGIGAAQLMMERLGLTNIAADIDESWASFSREAVIRENPDVIVLVDAAWHTAEHKIQALESNPATAKLSAVRNKHYLIVDFAATEAGVRIVPAVLDLAVQLDRLDFD